MKFTFIDLDGKFVVEIDRLFRGWPNIKTKTTLVQDLERDRICFVSPSNSLGFMDSGIDKPLSQEMFVGIEKYIRALIFRLGRESIVGKKYLPIGSAMLTEYRISSSDISYMISAPSMLLPQLVKDSRNAYYAMSAVLNVLDEYEKRHPGEIDEVVVPGLCCGWGGMSPEQAAKQIRWAFLDHYHLPRSHLETVWYPNGVMVIDTTKEKTIIEEQPNFYENSEWKKISPEEMTTDRKSDKYLESLI